MYYSKLQQQQQAKQFNNDNNHQPWLELRVPWLEYSSKASEIDLLVDQVIILVATNLRAQAEFNP
jgi:hypothetical protein